MKQPWIIGLVGAVLVVVLSVTASAYTYSTYYTCLPGTVTAVVLTNASEYDSDEAFTLTLFSAQGEEIGSISQDLTAYQSAVVFLNDLIANPGEYSWGLASIDTTVLLQVGVWIGTESSWVSVSNLRSQALATEGVDIAYYWYGANYANTENRRAGIGLVNPSEASVGGTLYVYNASGALLNYSDFELAAHHSAYFNPESILPIDQETWGLIDVRATNPILLVSEYYDAAETLLDVDIIGISYFLQVDQEGGGDSS
jgi:hypothetical protein